MVEIGPLAYRESWQRFDLDFSHGGNTVAYTMHKTYTLDPSQSAPGLGPTDTVTNMDMAAVKLRSMFKAEAALLKVCTAFCATHRIHYQRWYKAPDPPPPPVSPRSHSPALPFSWPTFVLLTLLVPPGTVDPPHRSHSIRYWT